MELSGLSLIGFGRGAVGGATWQAPNPVTGEQLGPVFHSASAAELDRATRLASDAAPELARSTGADRGRLGGLAPDERAEAVLQSRTSRRGRSSAMR